MKRFGRKVLIGDLAIRKEQAHLIDNVCDDLPEGGDADEDPVEEGNEVPKERETKNLVVDITEQNIHEFSLFEVVMPMIGHEIRLPANKDLQEIFSEIMAADGIKMSHFTNQSTIQATSAAGSYRRIIQKPSQVVFDIVEMQLENEDLLTPNYLAESDPTPKV